MEKNEIKELLKRYQQGNCTEVEKALLEAWYLEYNEEAIDISSRRLRAIGEQVYKELPGNSGRKLNAGLLLAAASIAVIALSVVLNVVFNREQASSGKAANDISPGGNKAILTLANGKKIDLSKAANGRLTTQQGMKIIKTAAGQLTYQAESNEETGNPAITNTITTPAGGTWQVRLPDGTRVWLNNASSLSYPGSFRKQENRKVKLEGEAYFEVAKDKAHPFIVKSGVQEVRVLGTHFNIHAFSDEQVIKTTLLEGSVSIRVNAAGKPIVKQLMPGKQSLVTGSDIRVMHANAEEALAWKNGYFRFDHTPIENVMRELARWYDIEVRYDGPKSTENLNGRISRFKNVSQVLKALEATKTVHFQLAGRRVIVMK